VWAKPKWFKIVPASVLGWNRVSVIISICLMLLVHSRFPFISLTWSYYEFNQSGCSLSCVIAYCVK